MPETRYIEEYNYPPDIPASEKTIANAEANGWITTTPYRVSDEELALEQLKQDANDASHRCVESLAIWDTLTSSAQKAVVKNILIVIKQLATKEGLL